MAFVDSAAEMAIAHLRFCGTVKWDHSELQVG